MRRSTKITIGVVVFLLICLIVGLTLYFVLSKKSSSGSAPTDSPSQKQLIQLSGTITNVSTEFQSTKNTADGELSAAIQSGTTTKIASQIALYLKFYIRVKSYLNDTMDQMNSILQSGSFTLEQRKSFSKLASDIAVAVTKNDQKLQQIPDSRYTDKAEVAQAGVTLVINQLSALKGFIANVV
jgi:hypothetical protein